MDVTWERSQDGLYLYTLIGDLPSLPEFRTVKDEAKAYNVAMAQLASPIGSTNSPGSTGWSLDPGWLLGGAALAGATAIIAATLNSAGVTALPGR